MQHDQPLNKRTVVWDGTKTLFAILASGATIVAVWLGFLQYSAGSRLAQYQATTELHELYRQIRQDYNRHCIRETEALRPAFRDRYNALVALVDSADRGQPPWSNPCRWVDLPRAPGLLSFSPRVSHSASTYPDWDAFAAANPKKAFIWIGDIPITIDFAISEEREALIEDEYRLLREQVQLCAEKEREKPENLLLDIECVWSVDRNTNDATMYRIESRRPAVGD